MAVVPQLFAVATCLAQGEKIRRNHNAAMVKAIRDQDTDRRVQIAAAHVMCEDLEVAAVAADKKSAQLMKMVKDMASSHTNELVKGQSASDKLIEQMRGLLTDSQKENRVLREQANISFMKGVFRSCCDDMSTVWAGAEWNQRQPIILTVQQYSGVNGDWTWQKAAAASGDASLQTWGRWYARCVEKIKRSNLNTLADKHHEPTEKQQKSVFYLFKFIGNVERHQGGVAMAFLLENQTWVYNLAAKVLNGLRTEYTRRGKRWGDGSHPVVCYERFAAGTHAVRFDKCVSAVNPA